MWLRYAKEFIKIFFRFGFNSSEDQCEEVNCARDIVEGIEAQQSNDTRLAATMNYTVIKFFNSDQNLRRKR